MPTDAYRVAAFVVLPLLAGLQALGWYMARSTTWLYQVQVLGESYASSSTSFAFSQLATVAGCVLSALIAALVGPLPTAALGFALAAVGTALLAMAPDAATFATTSLVTGLGVGLYRPALVGAAAVAFERSGGLRVAVLALMYVAINAAAMVAPYPATALFETTPTAGFWALAGAVTVAGVVTLGLFAASFVGRTAEAAPPPPDGVAIAAGLGVAALGAAGMAAWSIGFDAHWQAVYGTGLAAGWWGFVNPMVVIFAGVLVAAMGVVAHVLAMRPPLLILVGGGLTLLGVGLAPATLIPGSVGVVAGSVLGGVGEALVWSSLVTRATERMHWRLAVVPPAMLVAATGLAHVAGDVVGRVVGARYGTEVLVWGVIPVVLVFGVVALAVGVVFDRGGPIATDGEAEPATSL